METLYGVFMRIEMLVSQKSMLIEKLRIEMSDFSLAMNVIIMNLLQGRTPNKQILSIHFFEKLTCNVFICKFVICIMQNDYEKKHSEIADTYLGSEPEQKLSV